jgi:hypothetical protein
MELSNEERERVAKAVKDGVEAPDGPLLDHYNPLELAQAIEHELVRAVMHGQKKIQIRLDFADAARLVNTLRNANG